MTPIPLESEKELAMVKTFVLLPIILDVLQRDMDRMQRETQLKMIKVYVRLLKQIQDQALRELQDLRRAFRQRGIKVYRQRRTAYGLEADYLCRGYHYHLALLWGQVKAELEVRLSEYMRIQLAEGEAGRERTRQ